MSIFHQLPSHVAKQALEASFATQMPRSTNLPSDSPLAFLERAMGWVSDWVDRYGEDAVKQVRPFAIVYAESIFPDPSPEWLEEPLFREDPDLDLGGKILVTMTSMLEVRARATSASRLKELGEQLTALGLDKHPVLLVDAANGLLLHCVEGIRGPRSPLGLDIAPMTDLSEEAIEAELEQFHRLCTKYPEGLAHAWHERKSRTLRRDAEAIVRDVLYIYFRFAAFRAKKVAREEQTTVGRPDISIYEVRNSRSWLMCVFELKVLRSRGQHKNPKASIAVYKPEKMLRHARMGVRQAIKYKTAENAKLGYLCLYDGRDNDEDIPEVQTFAKDSEIIYKRYYMETSTRDDLEDSPEEVESAA